MAHIDVSAEVLIEHVRELEAKASSYDLLRSHLTRLLEGFDKERAESSMRATALAKAQNTEDADPWGLGYFRGKETAYALAAQWLEQVV